MKTMKIKLTTIEELDQMSLIFSWNQMLQKFKFSDNMLVIVLANAALETAENTDILAIIEN